MEYYAYIKNLFIKTYFIILYFDEYEYIKPISDVVRI